MSANSFYIEWQQRDLKLLHGLVESRIMTLRHIAIIYFSGRFEAAKKRVQRLRKEGYMSVRTPSTQGPVLHVLTRKGFDILRIHPTFGRKLESDWRTVEKRLRMSTASIPHELAVMDCKAAVHASLSRCNHMTLSEFSTRPESCQFTVLQPTTWNRVLVKPDAFIQLREHGSAGCVKEYRFFLEVDRSTESTGTLLQKLLWYREYSRAERARLASLQDANSRSPYPYRVLLVLKSRERQQHMIAQLHQLQPPIKSLVIAVTSAETENILEHLFPRSPPR